MYRVSEIKNDTIWMEVNEYEVDDKAGMYKLEGPENWGSFSIPYVKSELDALFESGEWFDVDRP